MKRIRRYLGLEKRSEYVNNYFARANFRSSIYMSIVIIVLELWMIISLIYRWSTGDTSRDIAWYSQHMTWYVLFLLTAIFMLIFARLYLKNITDNFALGMGIMIFFSAIALYFGISVSYSDYTRGEQILCFIMMIIFVVGLLNWRPYISIIISSLAFGLFYMLMSSAPEVEMTYATQVNYFMMWVAVVMLGLAVYSQRLSEAEKDEKLENHSIRDDLTGLANMASFREQATQVLADHANSEHIFLFLDISNFKAYNEKYGFDAGSEFIRNTAKVLHHTFHRELVARFSDDHFVALTVREGLEDKLDEINRLIREQHKAMHMMIKAGAYAFTGAGVDPLIACDRARYACSTIKKHGDTILCEYDLEMDDAFKKRQYIINHLHEAIEKQYLKVYYQPVVWAKDRSICSVEALARWIDPTYGFLSPADFISALEEYRLIHWLDAAILEQVCRDIREGLDEGRQVLPVSVNFSRLDFELTDVTENLQKLIRKYNIPESYLHVEITESALIGNDEKLKNAVQIMKEKKLELWLDDFGSGYSALNVLKEYAFDVMKIDMIFLNDFEGDSKTKALLTSIVNMAESIGMKTLTEGVETEEQARFLTEIGCERMQGYLFGKPMPLKSLLDHDGVKG